MRYSGYHFHIPAEATWFSSWVSLALNLSRGDVRRVPRRRTVKLIPLGQEKMLLVWVGQGGVFTEVLFGNMFQELVYVG